MAALVGSFWSYPVPEEDDPGGRKLVQGWKESARATRVARALSHASLVEALPELMTRIAEAQAAEQPGRLREAIYDLGKLTELPAPAFHLRACCLLIVEALGSGEWSARLDALLELLPDEAQRVSTGAGEVSPALQSEVTAWKEAMHRLEVEDHRRRRGQ